MRECTRTLNHGCGSSSNGSCRDDLALGARSDASTQQITGPPLRLRGRPLLMAAIRHDLVIHVHTTTASGPSRSLEQLLVLCLFSSMADRGAWLRHPIHRDTLLPQVARLVSSLPPGSLSCQRSPPSWAAHPFDGDSFFVSDGVETLLYHGYASTSRPSSGLSEGILRGGCVPVRREVVVLVLCRSSWTSASLLPGFSPKSVLTGTPKVRSD